MKTRSTILIFFMLCSLSYVQAACSLDHILVGCNPDGDPNTLDDNDILYLDCFKKYRRCTLEGNWPDDYWKNWYYAMEPGWGGICYLGEPGLDFVDDPNSTPQDNYNLKVECIALSDNLAVLDDSLNILIEQPGDTFDYTTSGNPAPHVHLTYRVSAGGENQTQWFTFHIYDVLGNYQPSEECTIVFCQPVIPGDIAVDDVVDIADLEKLAENWLLVSDETQINIFGQAAIDSFNGTDINRDYQIDFMDFVLLGENWGL